ncbi:MAG: transposase, partial [Deltaproteobacteria bacterium]|nr:transposase [Deltaproteobacteria bacterium]
DLFNKILTQGKYSKNKIYSLHEPHVKCIAKGKSGVRYEYGNKLTILMTPIDCIVLGVANIKDNRHDSATIPEIEEILLSRYCYKPPKLILDMGYRGYQKYTDLDVIIPHKDDKKLAPADFKTKVEALNRRSAIEQCISHMKNDFKLGINYLRGELGDTINPIFSAAALNLRKYVIKYKEKLSRKLAKLNYRKLPRKRKNKKITSHSIKIKRAAPKPLFDFFRI